MDSDTESESDSGSQLDRCQQAPFRFALNRVSLPKGLAGRVRRSGA